MIRSISLFILLAATCATAQDLKTVRELYPKAPENAGDAKALYNMLSEVSPSDDPVLAAYKGASLTLLAKFANKVKDKVRDFKSGSELIDAMVAEHPENIEIRYIRLSVQENSPKIVKYKRNIEEDKTFILDNFKSVSSSAVSSMIKDYVGQSNVFNASEKQLF